MAGQREAEQEDALVSGGLSTHAVQTLTRLFERVRYGSLSPESGDEAAAVACLAEIVSACQTGTSHAS